MQQLGAQVHHQFEDLIALVELDVSWHISKIKSRGNSIRKIRKLQDI